MEIIDKIHGKIDISDDIAYIIATEPFQRLKHVHQLGLLHQAIPNAVGYMRYEHCIGTHWQAKKMLNSLEHNTEWLRKLVQSTDISSELCQYLIFRKAVEIAALLHDVGHGPFSHLWEHAVDNFCHEDNAKYCIDYIFEMMDPNCFQSLRSHNNYGINLIKDLVLGEPRPTFPIKYRFLFEIVNNKQCLIDVDKWDYLQRDHAYLFSGKQLDFQIDEIFMEAKATADGGHIQYRFEDYNKIYMLFKLRTHMHSKCYRAPKVHLREVIFCRMMKRWPDILFNGKKLTQIDASDMTTFLMLIDETVLKLFANDKEFKYLTNEAKILSIDNHAVQNQSNESVEHIDVAISAPGEEMPNDERIYLYGDASAKIAVDRDMESYHNVGYFILAD